MNLKSFPQYPVKVYYNEVLVGDYFADILVEKKIILELKAAKQIQREHEIQLLNYLRASDLKVGLLLNFGKKPEFKRKICTIKPKNQRQSS